MFDWISRSFLSDLYSDIIMEQDLEKSSIFYVNGGVNELFQTKTLYFRNVDKNTFISMQFFCDTKYEKEHELFVSVYNSNTHESYSKVYEKPNKEYIFRFNSSFYGHKAQVSINLIRKDFFSEDDLGEYNYEKEQTICKDVFEEFENLNVVENNPEKMKM